MTQTPPQAEKATKTKRKDCLQVTIKVQIPLDMTDSKSLAAAIDASEKAKAAGNWPDGSVIVGANSMGKV